MLRKLLSLISMSLFFGCTITGNIVKEPSFGYDVYFCPEHNCLEITKSLIETAEMLDCAFYSIDPALVNLMKNTRLVVDSNSKINASFVRKGSPSRLMHNKFCVINRTTVLTGSFNPTKRAVNDKNNILLVKSAYLAGNYEDEFEELWKGAFNKGKETRHKTIYLNNSRVNNYFCPEDGCAEKVADEIQKAGESIFFLAYSFTHKGIADSLLEKKGVEIKGVFSRDEKYSQYGRLKNNSVDVRLYTGKGLMHSKVFIIDRKTIITGSFNPTNNADKSNDENLLIIKNRDIAGLYLREFEDIYQQSR